MHRTFSTLLAVLLLVPGISPPAAAADDPLTLDVARGPKMVTPGDFLGASHPGVEIVARPIGTGGRGLWSAHSGAPQSRNNLLAGSADELRRLVDAGAVGGLQIMLEMKEAAVTSQGVVGSEVEAWHGAGWTGRGMTIGILDSSFSGYSSLLGIELPSSVATASFHTEGLERGTNRHGTAVAEIIHDAAPGAALVLVNADPDKLDRAVDFFIAQGVDVINLSGGWSVGPFDGTAEQDVEVNRAIDAGIVWVNAAGNEADQHFASTYQDGDSDGWSELSGSVEINDFFVPAGDEFQIVLNWTEPTRDLDLCLWDLDPAGGGVEMLDCSEGLQDAPWHQPLEVVNWINTDSDTHWFGFSVGGDPLNPVTGTRYDIFTNVVVDLALQTPISSLLVPNATERVISVGAVPHFNHSLIEPYSSRGPTADGRVKPDLVGPDRVATATYGSEFSGTSAASPFVAGMAALYLNMYPAATPIDVRRELGQLADGAGKNNTFGWGYARLSDPGGERVGVHEPGSGHWTLRMPDGTDNSFYYGVAGDIALMCDWNGDGVDTPGLYRRTGYVYIRYSNDFGIADQEFFYGIPGDIPVCGDWDGDGDDTVGVFRPSTGEFFLRNSNTQGPAQVTFHFGLSGDDPFAGDWDGDGTDTVGMFRSSSGYVYITNQNVTSVAEVESFYGMAGDRFVVGDWDGDGEDTFGIFRPSDAAFHLANEIGQATTHQVVELGSFSSGPVAGTFE